MKGRKGAGAKGAMSPYASLLPLSALPFLPLRFGIGEEHESWHFI